MSAHCRVSFAWLMLLLAATAYGPPVAAADAAASAHPAPTARDWAALEKLPDWSGVWVPNITDQMRQERSNPPPWTPAAAKQSDALREQERAGDPKFLFAGCLPHGMPAWMLIGHDAVEILFTPGRVTMLGEGDGNRLRRIYTDGRRHPEDPDLTFHGHSIGHWEGDTLVVDTIGVRPETYIAIGEGNGIPNDGDMHVIERIHLVKPDLMYVDMEITAPKVLAKPWKTTRAYTRRRDYDIEEGVCQQSAFSEATDNDGNAVFVPVARDPRGVSLSPTK